MWGPGAGPSTARWKTRAARRATLPRRTGRRRWAAAIIAAHTADDAAETIPAAPGAGQRPARPARHPGARRGHRAALLGERRETLRTALVAAGIGYALDPTNIDPAHATRNRVARGAAAAPWSASTQRRSRPSCASSAGRGGRRSCSTRWRPPSWLAAALLARERWLAQPPVSRPGKARAAPSRSASRPTGRAVDALLDAAEGPRGGLRIELGGGRSASVRERASASSDPTRHLRAY